MEDIELLGEILGVAPPWQVKSVIATPEEQRLDIRLGYLGVARKSFFSFGLKKGAVGAKDNSTCPHCKTKLPSGDDYETIAVRHLSVAGFTTYLHIPASGIVNSPKSDCICMKTWRSPGTYCSEAMFEFSVEMLKLISDSEEVRGILKLTSDEMQQILETANISKGTQRKPESSSSVAVQDLTEIPGFNHPSWLKLVKGEFSIHSKVIALSMILNRVQTTYLKSPSIETGAAGVKMLRQFFLRNERLLKKEIAVLNLGEEQETTGAEQQEVAGSRIPSESSSVWEQLVKGEINLNTQQVALQMLLRQIQKSISQNPIESIIKSGIKNMRNFFVKNERLLDSEIEQLIHHQR